MSAKVKVSGTFRNVTAPYIKVNGNWKISKSAWIKVNGSWRSWFLQGGLTDPTFTTNVGSGANNSVLAITIQLDGKIILAGAFTSFNATTVGRIIRLNSDGTIDTAFSNNVGTGGNSQVSSVAIQSDGKIVVAGSFGTWNGVTVNRIVRLNPDGTRDADFTTNLGSGPNEEISNIAIQEDDKILVVGSFRSFSGVSVNCIVRLNLSGSRDTTFSATEVASFSPYFIVNTLAINPDGKIFYAVTNRSIITDEFGQYFVFKSALFRMNSTGGQDSAFNSVGTEHNGAIYAIRVQADGKTLVGGNHTTWNGVTVNRILRLNIDGTRDTSFAANTGTGPNSPVWTIATQSDGKIVVGGQFTAWNGVAANGIVRLNPDGTRDAAFSTNIGSGANSAIRSTSIQVDSKIILAGQFTQFNGVTINRIVRIGGELAE